MMAREKYLRDEEAIPKLLREQAEYWLRVYNGGGKGTVTHYIEQWHACGCPALMADYKE